ncbi:MAG: hypothetical protein KC983_05095, partial [Phycisphaerales bacterium]|nr:hypothetical protein [Phycisphaerales bacterium]
MRSIVLAIVPLTCFSLLTTTLAQADSPSRNGRTHVAGDITPQDQDLLMRMQAAGDLYQNHLQRLVALRTVAMQDSNVDQLLEIDRLFDDLESQHMMRLQAADRALSPAGRQLMHDQWDSQMARMAPLRRDFVQRRAERDRMFNTHNA